MGKKKKSKKIKNKRMNKKNQKHLEEFGTLDVGLQAPMLPRLNRKNKSSMVADVYTHQLNYEKEDDLAFAKGCLSGLIIAIPMWIVIIGVIKVVFF